jgi:uncharacterized protein (TIGR02118 family)
MAEADRLNRIPVLTMIKAVTYLKRRPGMPVAEFQTYWREQHPAVVEKLPGLRRYIQSHTRLGAYHKGEPVYDGIAEVWFDDTKALRAIQGTPEMAAVQQDELNFIDRKTMGLIITDDYVIIDGPTNPGMARGIGFVKRKPGMAVEAFQKHWREVHGPMGKTVPHIRRYEQSHTRLSAYKDGREPKWDGISSTWFDDSKALRAAMTSPEFRQVQTDDANFIAPGPVPFIITTERLIVG